MQPWYLLFWVMTAFASREQQLRIDYLVTENAILREKIGPRRRLLLSDSQRIRLAEKAKVIGRTGPNPSNALHARYSVTVASRTVCQTS
jgi:hypothetical protein